MSLAELLVSSPVALLIGFLLGVAGVGGVLLAPWLSYAVGLSVSQTLGVVMLAFMCPGLAAVASARSVQSPGGSVSALLVLGAALGALAGALVLNWLPNRAALLVLGLGLLAMAIRQLWPDGSSRHPAAVAQAPSNETFEIAFLPERPPETAAPGRPPAGWGTGVVTGFASALTVTGGPLVLIPLLLWRGVPLRAAIAQGQAVLLPVAAAATATQWAVDSVDARAGLWMGALMVPGLLAGQRLAPRLPLALISRTVAVLLLVSAVALLARAVRG